jgi:hypothetical protein
MIAHIVLAAVLAAAPAPGGHDDPELVPKSFVILKATRSYGEARALAAEAASSLAIRMDLRQLTPDGTLGLTFPEDACESEFGEFPCYVPRGRWDDGVYISVEHSSSYHGLDEGLYLVVLASGAPHDRAVRAALRRAKPAYPDAHIRTVPVFIGCIH